MDGFAVDIAGRVGIDSLFVIAHEFDSAVGQFMETQAFGIVDGFEMPVGTSMLEVVSDTTLAWYLDMEVNPLLPTTLTALVLKDGVVTQVIPGLPDQRGQPA